MGSLLAMSVRLRGVLFRRAFERATHDPQAAQAKLLQDILSHNRETEYGRKHSFSKLKNGKAYAAAVPIKTFSDLAPDVEKMINGQENILTADQPVLFNITSGTTDKPKFIPVTKKGRDLIASATLLWFQYALKNHPEFLDRSCLIVTGAAVEKITASGIPCGSASGMIHSGMPGILRRSFVLPTELSEIRNYDLRYYLIARLALEQQISIAATPNPGTLLKIAEAGICHKDELVRAIHDGVLFRNLPLPLEGEDKRILASIGSRIKPNRPRARELEQVIRQRGELLPSACWKSLNFIGCWLGGSAGFHAEKLTAYFGADVPKRDLGLLASEASMTIPLEDGTAAGVLALDNNYYEFMPTDGSYAANDPLPLCHELEIGQRYRILLTNWNGLYRYDIQDVVEVRGFHNKTPLLAFVEKSSDFLNIAGEKLHINHLLKAFRRLENEQGIRVSQFRAVSNVALLRHELLLWIETETPPGFLQDTALPAIDRALCDVNIEYYSKRQSGRLEPPVLHVMDASWAEASRRYDIENGRRDIQYKWRAMATKISELDADHITHSIQITR